MKLVAGTYEIETQFVSFDDYLRPKSYSEEITWIDTAITYNNDYFIKGWKGNIISKISPFMYRSYDWWVSNHLNALGRSKIEIMLVHNVRNSNWIKLYIKMLKDDRFKSVGVSNVSIKELEEIKKSTGNYPEWVETEINPEYCDVALLDFCKSHRIKIIAYAIFGGKYNAKRNISRYTIPVILNSVSKVADLVIVRWDTPSQLGRIIESTKVNTVQSKLSIDWKTVDKIHGLKNKSIVPTKFNAYPYIYFDRDGFPISESVNDVKYGNLVGLNGGIDLSRFKDITEIDSLEFPTEYAALMRYQEGRHIPVAILDEEGYLEKVKKLGYKVYAKI